MEYLNVFVFLCVWLGRIANSERQEICENKELNIQCSTSEAVLTDWAKYGRMKIGKCVKNDLGYLGCQNDVLRLVDKWCSGLQSCRVQVSNDELSEANTACLADLNSYLEVEYTCAPVTNPGARCSTTPRIITNTNHGYISSYVTSQTGCGSQKAPWVIQAQPGQVVHLWMIDFGALGRQHQSLHTSCHQIYGFIVERDLGVNLTMCGGTERKTEIYKSKTNKVEVHILLDKRESSRFFVHYLYVGCPDLSPPAHAWYKRDGEEAMIGCKSNDRVWRLYCNGNTWNGVVGNCSKAVFPGDQSATNFDIPFSTVIILTSVICGAILLIIVVVVSGAVYVKRQRIRHDLKLRSDYGMISQAQYYTLKGTYGTHTMTCSSTQLPVDSQPLVHIVDKVDTDKGQSHNDSAGSTIMKPPATHIGEGRKEMNSPRGNLI